MLERLGYNPDPQNPGWLLRPQTNDDCFLDVYGEMRVRAESETVSRMRLTPRSGHRNILDTIHGGFLLAVIDHALFVGPTVQGRERAEGGNTIDVTTQFLSPVLPDREVDIVIETLRETYRMIFVRGTIEQAGTIAVAFSGTIKKASKGS